MTDVKRFSEIGSKIFAICSVITTAVAVIYIIRLAINLALYNCNPHVCLFDSFDFTLIILAIIFILSAFIMSVLLLIGIEKKKPKLLKLYINYGIGIMTICIAMAVRLLVQGQTFLWYGLMVLGGCFGYFLILLMIYMTHPNMELGMKI